MTKLQKARNVLNERFRQIMPQVFHDKFGVEIETKWNFFDGNVYSKRVDGEPLSDEQEEFIFAFEAGYMQSLIVLDELMQGAAQ